jgi:hypothetical protein
MIERAAVAEVKARALIIQKFLSDVQISALLVDHTMTATEDGVTTTTYDTRGCAVACLQSIRALVPLMKNIGGVQAMYESLDKTIYGLSPGGCITATRPYQTDVGDLVEVEDL